MPPGFPGRRPGWIGVPSIWMTALPAPSATGRRGPARQRDGPVGPQDRGSPADVNAGNREPAAAAAVLLTVLAGRDVGRPAALPAPLQALAVQAALQTGHLGRQCPVRRRPPGDPAGEATGLRRGRMAPPSVPDPESATIAAPELIRPDGQSLAGDGLYCQTERG